MSLLRKGLLMSAGQVSGVILNTLANILFSYYLGPAGTGQTELFRATQTIAITLLSFGIGSASVYFLNDLHVETERIVANTLKSTLVICGFVSVVLSSAIIRHSGYFGHLSALTAWWFATSVGSILMMYALRWVLIAQLAARKLVWLELTSRLIVLIGGGILAVMGMLSSESAIAVLGLGNIGATVLILIFLRRYISLSTPFDWKLFKSLLAYSVKLAAVNLLYVLSFNITLMLLRYLRPNDFSSVGLYARAVGIGSMITMFPAAIGPLLYARWAGVKGETRARQGEMAMRMNVTFGVLSCLLLLSCGKLIIKILYGEAFVQANDAMQILAPSLIFMTMFSVCDNMLAGDGRASITAYILAGTLGVTMVLAWLLTPLMGIRGTAMAALSGNFFTAVTSLAICRKFYGLKIHRCLFMDACDFQKVFKSFRQLDIRKAQEG